MISSKSKITKSQSDLLKLVAIISMAVDHVGAVFFPGLLVFRIIGRLAYPLFAYQLSIGYEKTKDFSAYMIRLAAVALISQVPYMLVFDTIELNILFTFMVALLVIYTAQKRKWLFFTALVLVSAVLPLDYGLYGALMPFVFWLLRKDSALALVASSAWTALFSLLIAPLYQLYALAGIGLALFWRPEVQFKLNKWAFYIFYPAHLTLIYLISFLLP